MIRGVLVTDTNTYLPSYAGNNVRHAIFCPTRIYLHERLRYHRFSDSYVPPRCWMAREKRGMVVPTVYARARTRCTRPRIMEETRGVRSYVRKGVASLDHRLRCPLFVFCCLYLIITFIAALFVSFVVTGSTVQCCASQACRANPALHFVTAPV